MARFGFCAASSLIWGDGGLLFHFILSEIVAQILEQSSGTGQYVCRIYSINCSGRLLNFWTLRGALIQGRALIKFSPFSASVACFFAIK